MAHRSTTLLERHALRVLYDLATKVPKVVLQRVEEAVPALKIKIVSSASIRMLWNARVCKWKEDKCINYWKSPPNSTLLRGVSFLIFCTVCSTIWHYHKDVSRYTATDATAQLGKAWHQYWFWMLTQYYISANILTGNTCHIHIRLKGDTFLIALPVSHSKISSNWICVSAS